MQGSFYEAVWSSSRQLLETTGMRAFPALLLLALIITAVGATIHLNSKQATPTP